MGAWRDEQRLVEQTLTDLRENQIKLAERVAKVEIELAILRTKAATIGGLAGFIAGMVVRYLLKL